MSDAMAVDWRDVSYLARGNARQQRAYRVLQSLGIFDVLRAYNPVLAGTLPLDIDIEHGRRSAVIGNRRGRCSARDSTA